MFAALPRHLALRLQLLLSSLGVAVVLLLAASAHSPGLHAWFHPVDNSCDHAHEPSAAPAGATTDDDDQDRCAIVLFAQGVTELAPAVFTHTERVLAGQTLPSPPPAPRLAPPSHAHPPSHAPPARLPASAFTPYSSKPTPRPFAGPHSTPHHALTLCSR